MSYEPHLISDFATGQQDDKQPWLIPDDAQQVIYDGYIEHGVINKRDGYNFFATGAKSGVPYCESRMVRSVAAISGVGAIDSVNKVYSFDTSAVPDQVRRGSIVVTGTAPAQVVSDDGVGGSTGDGTLAPSTIDYYDFDDSIVVTFTDAPTAGTVTLVLDYHPGLPVMMIANYTTDTNSNELIVADTDFVNKYNSTTNRFDDITNQPYTGDNSNFFSWVQYPTIIDGARLLFVNNVDLIQSYDGTTVADFYPVYETTAVTGEAYDTGNGGMGPYTHTAMNLPVYPGSITITEAGGQTATDDGVGGFTGAVSAGTVNYLTGEMSVTFNANVLNLDAITVDYSWESGQILTCLHLFNYKDRLICLRTTETGGTIYPQRIRISGTGQSGDDFRTTATGAGVIDIPDQDWITGASFNRDDLMIFTRKSTWVLKYTGNDIVPFSLDKIDGTRGNLAPFAPISYLNMTKAYSPYGFTITDGYQVQRYDKKIPDYAFEEIDQENFKLCFSGSVDDERNHYLIHPHSDSSTSDRILVNNYEENLFSIYRIPLSCMGNYFESFDITWNDLLVDYPDPTTPGAEVNVWDQFAQDYATWNDLSYAKDQPLSLGGGHTGEIWRLNKDEAEDNPVRIYAITTDTSEPLVINVQSDWNNYVEGDFIYIAGVNGAVEINGRQGFIPRNGITDNNNFKVEFDAGNPEEITAYTSGGLASRVIPFEIISKNFNPYSEIGVKVRCGWIYLYTDTSKTSLSNSDDEEVPAKLEIAVFSNDNNQPTKVTSANIPYESNITNFNGRTSKKKWTKVFINQTGEFIQFQLKNAQTGSQIRIHAMMPGFMQTGRLL